MYIESFELCSIDLHLRSLKSHRKYFGNKKNDIKSCVRPKRF